jgi:hypothetical protein
VSATCDRSALFQRDIRKLTGQQRREFLAARDRLVIPLRSRPPEFTPALRVKRVQGMDDIWEMTWAEDGRATFRYGPEVKPGEPHVIWLRIGIHATFDDPDS